MKKIGPFMAVSVEGLFLIGLFVVSESLAAAPTGLTQTHSGGGVTVKVSYPVLRVLLMLGFKSFGHPLGQPRCL